MLSEESDKLIASFVPAFLRNLYSNNPKRKLGDPIDDDHATLLWIDLCNFSPLCARLMKDTIIGVEKITGILDSHYFFINNLVSEYGGQLLFFAGDGVMAAWPGNKNKATESVQLAAACARKIIENRTTVNDRGELISLHVILATGPWQMAETEGIQGQYLVSFFGEVFNDLSLASKNNAPDKLLITNKALALLSNDFKSEIVEHATSILYDSPTVQRVPEVIQPILSDEVLEKLKLYIPRTLTFHLDAEHLKWMAEIRPVTILFVRLPNNNKSANDNLDQLRRSVALVKPLVQKYEGLLNNMWMDEKESNILICFGPPPSAHINNPERSVHLGFEIHHLMRKSGIDNSVGISSGFAYCGVLGNNSLRQYSVIGEVVNISAHIAGIKQNEIFCDKATFSLSNKTVYYRGQVMATVKGQTEPVSLYVPKGLLDDDSVRSNVPVSIGREKELAIMLEAFENLFQGKSGCIILEGESGMGKTKLLEDFIAKISTGDANVVFGRGDFVLRNTPYAGLRSIIASLLGIGYQESDTIPEKSYEDLIARFGDRACLLNIVLNTNIPDSEEIRTLTGAQRVQATQDLLLRLIDDEARKKPIIIIIDEARWIDESTGKLLECVKENIANSLIILSFQVTEGLPLVQGLKRLDAETITLKELKDSELETLICAKLGVRSISRDLAEVVFRISKGNPFFCIELTGSLMDQELLLFANNNCSLVKDTAIKDFSLPETVRGAIRQRIDRMGQGSQLSLKVGSVVGNRFAEKIISSIYPIRSERNSVPTYLRESEQFGFLNETVVDNMNGYLFSTATTVEVAYEMTLAEQRRQLHLECAEWYENNFTDNLQPFFVRLANHWNEANVKEKAAAYYEREAIRLFQSGFVKEALNVGLEGIRLLGQEIPRDLPSIGQKIGENMGAIGAMMQGKTIESLIDHKKLEDPKKEKVIKMLLSMGPFAHQSQQGELFALMTIICQRLTLEYGNGESAAEVYAMYSIIYKALSKDAQGAYTWSNLSLAIDKNNGYTLQSRVLFIHGWFIALWIVPIEELIPLAYKGADAGFKTGDILFACFNLSLVAILKSTCGKNLNDVIKTSTEHFIRNNNAVINAAFHLIHEEQVAKAFQGRTESYTSLTDEKYDEMKDIASICNTDLFNQIAYYLVSKLKLNVHFGNWDEAFAWGEKSIPLIPAFDSQPGLIEFEQFYTMSALYKGAKATEDVSGNFITIADAGIEKMNAWATLCPGNFLHKSILLEAIRDGFAGETEVAEQKFVQAADYALKAGYIQDQGLAYEHLVRMKKRTGADYSGYLQSALNAYQQWGADGKVNYLRKEFVN